MVNRKHLIAHLLVLLVATLALSGCGLIFGGSDTPDAEATREAMNLVVVPTFTPTPQGEAPAPTATIAFDAPPAAVAEAPAAEAPAEAVSTSVFSDLAPSTDVASSSTAITSAVASAPLTQTSAITTSEAATATPAARARLTVTQQGINVRTGPGTNYNVGGTANTGETFDIIGKNQAGDWWQVCCVGGEPVWIFGALATVENTATVPVAAAPAAPVAVAPAPAAPAPAAPADPPAAEPPPAEEPAPEPAPPADDPCAGIGGDGCKFRLTGGPAFGNNGGGELRLMLSFVHGGIDGGQPQGSYFVVLLKDGQNVGVPDNVRSVDPSGGGHQQSGLGRFNYDYKIGASNLPGGNIQGNYQIWVLDGNGERDSQTFSFSVPEGQGEVWMEFDQG